MKSRWRPLTSNSSEGRKQLLSLLCHFPQLIPGFLTDCIANQVIDVKIRNFGTLLAKMAKIEGAIGRHFLSLSIVFVCVVNTKLALLCGLEFSLQIYMEVTVTTKAYDSEKTSKQTNKLTD